MAARQTLRQFIEAKFDAVDARFDAMDAKFASKFDVIDTKFDAMDAKFDSMDARVNSMDTKFESKFDALFDIVDRNEKKLDAVFLDVRDVKAQMVTKDELRTTEDRLMSHVDAVYKRMGTFDHELTAHRATTERLDGRVTRVERHVGLSS